MKLAALASIACFALVACASAPKPEPAATPSAAPASAESAGGKTAAELWAEKKISAEVETTKKQAKTAGADATDPLAMGGELEESSIPKTEMTPPSQVRAKSPAELNAAVAVVRSESSVDGAAKKLTQRLGKPNWTESSKGSESAKRRIWVAAAGSKCQRLVLEADGSVEVETASKSEWRMLTASARQNPCTGEINRGLTNK